MTTLRYLQVLQGRWLDRNFPNADSWEALVGAMEELGELAHAHLKGHNLIRGLDNTEAIQERKADAVGDIIIYLASYCNTNDIDLEKAMEKSWAEVGARDWVKNSVDGRVDS
jgi:NTP pyrophosphatase (non-canonical NTP hydrolase)